MAVSSLAVVGLLAGLLAQSAATPPTGAPPTVTMGDIKKHVGREVTVCGPVVMYDCDGSSGLVLDLATPAPRDGISIAIPRELWAAPLGHGLTNQYVFANVCARGKVAKARTRYRVVAGSADAIQIATPPPAGSIQLAESAAQSCAAGVRQPELLREVKPNYTGDAMRGLQQGLVYLEAVVLPNGTVGDIRVLVPLEPDLGLNANAVTALQQWRFRPALLGGQPVPVLITVEMTFKLK